MEIRRSNVGRNVGRNVGMRQLNRLSARTIASKKRPGLYCDGGGLYLVVSKISAGASHAAAR